MYSTKTLKIWFGLTWLVFCDDKFKFNFDTFPCSDDDSDGDQVKDGEEVDQGSDPRDARDEGMPAEHQKCNQTARIMITGKILHFGFLWFFSACYYSVHEVHWWYIWYMSPCEKDLGLFPY